jgi:hypothetical protein
MRQGTAFLRWNSEHFTEPPADGVLGSPGHGRGFFGGLGLAFGACLQSSQASQSQIRTCLILIFIRGTPP